MTRRLVQLSFLTLGTSVSVCAHDDWSLNNHFSIYADFVYMRRAELHGHSIVDETFLTPQPPLPPPQPPPSPSPTPGPPAPPPPPGPPPPPAPGPIPQPSLVTVKEEIDTDQLVHQFDYRSGYRVGALYMPNKNRSFELSYLEIGEWKASRVENGPHNLSFPFDNSSYTTDFVNAKRAEATYHSRFNNWELNYWRHVTPRRGDYFSVSGIFGFRFIDLRERCLVQFTRGQDMSDYAIHTKNHLYGAQIGGNLQINPTRFWSWDATVKVGGLINRAQQDTFLGDKNNTVVLRDFDHRQYRWTYFGTAQLALAYQLWSHLNMHGGYEMLYLSGVALAPEQIDKHTSPASGKRLDARGNALIHGLFAGITLGF